MEYSAIVTQQIRTTANTDSLKKVRAAARSLYAFGFLCCFIGGITFAFAGHPVVALIVAFVMIFFGLLYAALGLMVGRKSKVALIVATIMTGLSIALGLVNAVTQSSAIVSLPLHSAILSQLLPAFSALEDLKQH